VKEKNCWLMAGAVLMREKNTVGWLANQPAIWLCWKLDGNIYMFSGYDYVQI